ncbi:glycosyltransferase family 25 protein [Poseidonocella sp. HB161398]|uniref:glycosyltransferase family 25 protein n=1 Tax=Poseidonocella sp. HB161398 TaxID=2320855 RepID=UPI001107B84C|nr:glycosyltransferase family 25 protein [Poseidonocella sp. HB161398]
MHAQLHVQVINLEGSRDRLAAASAHLEAAGLEFERCPAFDGRGKAPRELPGYYPPLDTLWNGTRLSGGEVGCYLSHLDAARRFLESGKSYGLVFEDDMHLTPAFPAVLEALLSELDAGRLPGWRLINLGATVKPNFRRSKWPLATEDGIELCDCFDFPLFMHGLLWSREGAERFLRRGSLILGTVDNWTRTDCAIHGHGYCLSVPIVLQQSTAGSIIETQPERIALWQQGGKSGWWKFRSTWRSRWRRYWGMRRSRQRAS